MTSDRFCYSKRFATVTEDNSMSRLPPACMDRPGRFWALGMGCEDPGAIYEKWHRALAKPLPPRIVDFSPLHEEVYSGSRLNQFALTDLPAPVEEPGFSCGIRFTAPFITKDPETGMRNVGMYSGHFRGRHKLIAGIARTHHAMLYHHPAAVKRGEPLPVAIVLGALPDINYVSAANLPYGLDELEVAGAIRGRPVDLVRCKTIPLEVPAEAEIVIEGEISPDAMERGEPFSDYPGYLMAERGLRPVIDVKAITHRRDPIFTAILVGLPPSESNGISRTCREMMLYNFLKYSCNLPEVLEVCCPEMGGGWNWWVIRMAKSHPSKPRQALQAASGMDTTKQSHHRGGRRYRSQGSGYGDVGDQLCDATPPRRASDYRPFPLVGPLRLCADE